MPRVKIKKLKELIYEDVKDESVKKDLETLEQLYQEARKAGLDKITMEEVEEEIQAAREEAKKEKEAKVTA